MLQRSRRAKKASQWEVLTGRLIEALARAVEEYNQSGETAWQLPPAGGIILGISILNQVDTPDVQIRIGCIPEHAAAQGSLLLSPGTPGAARPVC